ncbi:uncharacterized protein H6S33_002939 [Morchella sextelata]|uniref:uncharacterized protein n=1 Tax=Morchella sextelata TaxID=1174677 RepID=UPI001D0586E3|nr:uncharacterized protein H6S33_002939 [Morchella sextelata]KAH0606951.1 hypothetical protein H6S33_002939 [Morchella sextelata]
MTEALPKSRSSLSTITGTTTTSHNPTKQWTTARCHRLLRPLSSKLQALRSIVKSNPSVTTENAARPRPKRDPTDPDALFVEVVEKAAGTAGMGARRARARPQRTYVGAGGNNGLRNHRNHPPSAPNEVPSIHVDDSYLSIWGDSASNPAESESQSQPKRSHQAKPQDPNNPLVLLHSLKSHVHPSIFVVYLGIYTALESVLLSTKLPPSKTKVLPLRTLAARKIAHCILATSGEVDADDIWYDAAAELGSGGEYLRDVVRWHAIELVRESIADGLMKGRQGNNGGIGMAGVLIGLCRSCDAEQEAQSLLQTLFDLSPVISSSDHPPILTLQKLWFSDLEIIYRFLARNFPTTQSNPSWLGSTDIRKFLQLDLDENPGLEVLTTRALEAAFGLFGEEHINALSARRQKASRRKAENTILKATRELVPLSLFNPRSEAVGVVKQLVRGFLVQDAGVKSSTEEVWGGNWPVAAKIAILLQGLGSSAGDDNLVMDELARCLEDICSSGGKHALRSLAVFIVECYIPLYHGVFRAKEDPIQQLSNRLLSLAAVSKAWSSSHGQEKSGFSEMTPETPRNASGMKMIAVTFSVSEEVKSNTSWIDWLGRFEHKVIGLKIQTPGRVKCFLQPLKMKDELEKGTRANQRKKKSIEKKKGKRKGWRYEEGLDLWVAVGATPGRKEGREGLFMDCVEVEMPEEDADYDWRDEYEAISSDVEEASVIEEDEADEASIGLSEYEEEEEDVEDDDRPVTPSSSSSFMEDDSDEDADYYSNLRVTPPRTVRRSPRGTARIKKSLAYFSAIKSSSPMFTRTPSRTQSSGLKRQFNFSVVVDSSPFRNSSVVSSTIKRLGIDKDDWEDEDQDLDSEGVMMEDYSSPVLRRMERRQEPTEDDDKTDDESEEEEVIGDISFGDAQFGSPSPYSSPQPLPTPPSKRKREREIPLSELMEYSSSEEEEEEQEFKRYKGEQELEASAEEQELEASGEEQELEEFEEFEESEEDEEYQDQEMEDDMLEEDIPSVTALPSSPPPPTPPPHPRPPKRTSLGALRSMVNINDPGASPNTSLVKPKSKDLKKILERSAEKRRSKKKKLRAKKKRKTIDSDLSEDELGL